MIEGLKIIDKLSPELLNEIEQSSIVKEVLKGTEIIREGQYLTSVPIVLTGLIKVFTTYNEKEFLLYYLKPSESCVLSFIISQKQEPSKISARVEEDTTVLLMPYNKVTDWLNKYPEFSVMYFNQFNFRYFDLIDTLNHVLFDKLDFRLFAYLKEKASVNNTTIITALHKDIALELGTSREVITRVLKKLESEKKIIQTSQGIKIIAM
ncbi:Crp/Fnr family transcriptional regulator [Flavobacterium sp.]|jgi:CRP/FNR family transcriptional regulator|uniref:Crp/Fnr family transcriptional regulator n=1 Tax=Flavobacterium sp. TaxID=239 RepID=UPI0037C12A6D